ncbi:hypothetical protein [Citrobacter braakii]|uniref:hypothetical protein n=1 Tax=Citrobacter braakii TaxID=57706 RepID=UPI00244B8E59|nr:hypothetical protein [Citrobacter braakii]MDH1756129.1 hypothetical protein [Citrobacter braakii]MDH1854456.1 hypothetical protein [Citrobacter braakii]
MKKLFAAWMMILSLSGCVHTGIMVLEKGKDEPLMGNATGSLFSGTFEASNTKGFSCKGKYDPLDSNPMLDVTISCNDGRTGTARVLRTGSSLTDGSGFGKLNDGTEVKILLGNMIHYAGAEGYWHKD